MLSVLLIIKKAPIQTQIEFIKGISHFCAGLSPKRKEKVEILIERTDDFDKGDESRISKHLFFNAPKYVNEIVIDRALQKFDLKIWCVFGPLTKSWLYQEVCKHAGIAIHLNTSLSINKETNCWYYPLIGNHEQEKMDNLSRFLKKLYDDPGAIRAISQQSAEVYQELI